MVWGEGGGSWREGKGHGSHGSQPGGKVKCCRSGDCVPEAGAWMVWGTGAQAR